ncbi:MAG: phosphatase PAP2 family protein [Planctomycetota bacterium]
MGGLIFSAVLKQLFARPRPDLVPHGSAVYTASFPSGHSMMSAITYLTLGALLARVQTRKRLKAYLGRARRMGRRRRVGDSVLAGRSLASGSRAG